MIRCPKCNKELSLDEIDLTVQLKNGEIDCIFGCDLIEEEYYRENVVKILQIEHIDPNCLHSWEVNIDMNNFLEMIKAV